jgi:hypothetical protein
MSGNVMEIMNTLDAVTKTANEVRELLKKSLPPPPPAMNKADDETQQIPGSEGGIPPEGVAPEGVVAPEGQPEGAENPAMEGQEDMFGKEVASMSDDELTALLSALADEMEKRKAIAAEVAAPEAAAVPPPPAQPSPDMTAMKSENIEMKKSLQFMQKEIAALKKSMATPATRPASMNKPLVQNKVEPKVECLNKSEVLTHLENLKKSGNKSVDLDLIWQANSVKSPEDMISLYHDAKIKGIEIPNKK